MKKTFLHLLFFAGLMQVFAVLAQADTLPGIDTNMVRAELNRSKGLQYADAMAARDITYRWHSEKALDAYPGLKAEIALLHAEHEQACGSVEAAIEVFTRAIEAAEVYGPSSVLMAKALAMKGRSLNLKGESQLGMQEILKAQNLFETHGLEKEVAWCNNLLGDCYRQQQAWDKAFIKFRKALPVLEKDDGSLNLLDTYHSVIQAEVLKHRQDTAHINEMRWAGICLEKALVLTRKLNNRPYLALTLQLQGDLYCEEEAYQKALDYHRQAYDMFLASNFLIRAAEAKVGEARALLKMKRFEEVIKTLQPQLKFAAENGWWVELHQMYSMLAVSHHALGGERKGSIFGAKAFTLYKYIVQTKKELEMDALAAIYEKEKQKRLAAEKTKSRNSLLVASFFLLILAVGLVLLIIRAQKSKTQVEAKNREIEASNAALAESASRNAMLLREIHHRVKNNLQIISSLLELQARNMNDEEAAAVMQQGQNRVKAMSLIHKKLYQNHSLSTIDFQSYIEDLCTELHQLYQPLTGEVTQHIDANGHTFDIDTAIPLGLIINELVSNAYKHAFQQQPSPLLHIHIAEKDQGEFVLTVRDNGGGMPAHFELDKARSIGLRLVHRLAMQLGGKASFTNDNGSIFVISFKSTHSRQLID